jgi:hypothetical protein
VSAVACSAARHDQETLFKRPSAFFLKEKKKKAEGKKWKVFFLPSFICKSLFFSGF